MASTLRQPFIRKGRLPAGHPFHRLAQQHRCHRTEVVVLLTPILCRWPAANTGSFLPCTSRMPTDGLHSLARVMAGTLRNRQYWRQCGSPPPRHQVSGHAHVHGHHRKGSTAIWHTRTPGSQILRHCAGHAWSVWPTP